MKVTLYANISANGNVLLSENTNHRVPQEVISASLQDINQAGNLVMGRKSFENFVKAFGGIRQIREALPNVELVWLSNTGKPTDDYHVASSPAEAVNHLAEKGYDEMIVGGGTDTYNAFLENDLITDVVFNIIPIISNGGILGTNDALNSTFKLAGQTLLTEDVIQLRYRK